MGNEMMDDDFFSSPTWDDVLKRKKRLLVKYGFIKSSKLGEYTGNTIRQMDKLVSNMDDKKIDSLADCEVVELTKDWFEASGYPNSLGRNRLIYETTDDPIEEGYFFEKDMIQFDFWFHKFYKVTDSFAATEQSSLWGVSEQRVGLQQDKASQFLRGISEMIKAMFQIVRELRIIDERLEYYIDSNKTGSKTAKTSDYTLKGVYVDQVEGGSKNPASVYGLANTVGFSILPDIFFRTHVVDPNELDEQIAKLPFNEKVKEVLGRKLRQFLEWKKRTEKELKQRKKFTVKYLKQHYETVKLYISWIKPYLRNIERLQLDREKQDSADMVTAFEGSMAEVEFLATRKQGSAHMCLLLNFVFRTRPSMSYHAEGYQRGPMHIGRMDMNIRAYAWSDQQIKNYVKMMEEDNMRMVTSIDKALAESMDSLGDELFKYLQEEGGEYGPEKEEEKKAENTFSIKKIKEFFEPFTNIFGGASELGKSLGFKGMFNTYSNKGKSPSKEVQFVRDRDAAAKQAKFYLWRGYKNFKKAHKMITW